MPPREVHGLTPRTCEHGTLQGERDFTDMMKALKMGRWPWVMPLSPVSSQGPLRDRGRRVRSRREGGKAAAAVGVMWCRGPGVQVAARSCRRQGNTSPPKPPGGRRPLPHTWSCERILCVGLSRCVHGYLSQQPQDTHTEEVLLWGSQDSEEVTEVTLTSAARPWLQQGVGAAQASDRCLLAPQASVWADGA